MIVNLNPLNIVCIVDGIYQFDKGVELEFIGKGIENDTEIQFYKGALQSGRTVANSKVLIPDFLLSTAEYIKAYIFVRSPNYERTIKSLLIRIIEREKPNSYIDPPAESAYERLLPKGGNKGDVLVKANNTDYDVIWDKEKENYQPITQAEIDALFSA